MLVAHYFTKGNGIKLIEKSFEKNAFGMNLPKLVICFQKQDSCLLEYNHSKQKMAKDNC